MEEIHLFVIWSKAYSMKKQILEDMESRFCVLGIHKVSWSKAGFSKNLTRLYGENLPKNSNKEKLCGNEPFTLVVVKDKSPLYRTRMTSKGAKEVNVNMFDAKEMYRSWTGGGHMIHGTNDNKEVRHDLVLLTGMSVDDYVKKSQEKNKLLEDEYTEMPGEKFWADASQLLYVLNETVDYVILRNFEGIFSEVGRGIHGDVDILVSNFYAAKLVLNAKSAHRSKYRVQNIVKIGEGGIYFDIRYIGDNYYCKEWEKNILNSRFLDSRGYYRTDNENYIYALLYHAIVQKKFISKDYLEQFKTFFPKINDSENPEKMLEDILLEYLEEKSYQMVEANDYTVYFNKSITHKKMSNRKFLLKLFYKLF